MAFDLLLDVDFVDGELVVDGVGVAGLAVEEAGFEVEGVGQAVGGIDAHDQGAIAEPRELQAGGGGETGFSDASFAAEEKDAHVFIVAVGSSAAAMHGRERVGGWDVDSTSASGRVTFALQPE